jgi:ferrous iron transport protein A
LKVVFNLVTTDGEMNLAELTLGQIATVESVGGERSFRRRLMELGLVPGTRVELAGVAPLGDPVELLVRGASLSIRRAEASAVSVLPALEAAVQLAEAEAVGLAGAE